MPNRQFEMMGRSDVPSVKAGIQPSGVFIERFIQLQTDQYMHPRFADLLRRMEGVFLCMQKSGIADQAEFEDLGAVNHVLGKFNGDLDTRYYIFRGNGMNVLRQMVNWRMTLNSLPDLVRGFGMALGWEKYEGTPGVTDEPLLYNGSPKRPK